MIIMAKLEAQDPHRQRKRAESIPVGSDNDCNPDGAI